MLDVTRAMGLDFLFPQNDRIIGGGLKAHGHFAPAEVDLLQAYMARESGGTFLDLGANIGAVCLPLAKANPAWNFVSVEAHGGLAQILSANAYANHLYNVRVVRGVVGPEEAIVDFPEPNLATTEGNFGVLNMGRTGMPMARVLMQRIDDLAPRDTRIVKMDIEGHEGDALKGADHLLQTIRPIMLIEANPHYRASAIAVNARLLAEGYRLFEFYSPFAHAGDPPKKSDVKPPKQGDHGVLALPGDEPNLWDLPAIITADHPATTGAANFRYLNRYGYNAGG